jgi:hypothetical protein
MQDIYRRTTKWLEKTGCLHKINPDLIEEYALNRTRWLECEEVVSRTLYYQKNGDLIVNPIAELSLKYCKAADASWTKIWSIVAQNCEEDFGGSNPHTDFMEKLLRQNMG